MDTFTSLPLKLIYPISPQLLHFCILDLYPLLPETDGWVAMNVKLKRKDIEIVPESL
jgi:hypothetical protein